MMPPMVIRKNQKKMLWRQMQHLAQKHRRAQHIQKHAVKRNAAG